eukprot:2337749-Pleurochrysis_carterae.AAC.1
MLRRRASRPHDDRHESVVVDLGGVSCRCGRRGAIAGRRPSRSAEKKGCCRSCRMAAEVLLALW